MTTYAWPATRGFTPQRHELRVIDNSQRTAESSLSGYVQTTSMPGARWGWGMDFGAQSIAERAELEAYLMRLNGREHRVQLWDLLQPRPRGNIATSGVTVQASAAQFATQLVLAGCRPPNNLLLGSGFEIDTNADGIADGWLLYTSGTTGTIASALANGPIWTGTAGKFQLLSASTLNGVLGVRRNLPVVAGQSYALSAVLDATSGTSSGWIINWLNSSGVFISQSALYESSAPARRSVVDVAPFGAVTAEIYLVVAGTAGAAVVLYVDEAQFEQASASTTYQPAAALEAGDWLGLATGQLVRVTERAVANDAGSMTVSFSPMLRAALPSATAVVLDKPTALFVRAEVPIAFPREAGGVRPAISMEWVEVFA